MSKKPILCLDFDGVIHSYRSGWQGMNNIPDPPVMGAFDAIKGYMEHFEVHIFSSRSFNEGGLKAMKQWFWDQTDVDDSWINNIVFDTVKPPAKVTLDDRAITFTGAWPPAADLLAFEPWTHSQNPLHHYRAIINADAASYMRLEQKAIDLMNAVLEAARDLDEGGSSVAAVTKLGDHIQTLAAYLPIKIYVNRAGNEEYRRIGDEDVPRHEVDPKIGTASYKS